MVFGCIQKTPHSMPVPFQSVAFHMHLNTFNAGSVIHLTGSATAVGKGRVKAAFHESSTPLPSWIISVPERSLISNTSISDTSSTFCLSSIYWVHVWQDLWELYAEVEVKVAKLERPHAQQFSMLPAVGSLHHQRASLGLRPCVSSQV